MQYFKKSVPNCVVFQFVQNTLHHIPITYQKISELPFLYIIVKLYVTRKCFYVRNK